MYFWILWLYPVKRLNETTRDRFVLLYASCILRRRRWNFWLQTYLHVHKGFLNVDLILLELILTRSPFFSLIKTQQFVTKDTTVAILTSSLEHAVFISVQRFYTHELKSYYWLKSILFPFPPPRKRDNNWQKLNKKYQSLLARFQQYHALYYKNRILKKHFHFIPCLLLL